MMLLRLGEWAPLFSVSQHRFLLCGAGLPDAAWLTRPAAPHLPLLRCRCCCSLLKHDPPPLEAECVEWALRALVAAARLSAGGESALELRYAALVAATSIAIEWMLPLHNQPVLAPVLPTLAGSGGLFE